MKNWKNPEIEVLDIKFTELGKDVTPWIDDVYTDANGDNHYSFSGVAQKK